MKKSKKVMVGLFWLLIIGIMVAPLGLIYQISRDEMEKYEVPDPPKLNQTAFGTIKRASTMDVEEYVMLQGVFTSSTYADMELSGQKMEEIRWSVANGQEVQEGQSLGTYQGKEILSTISGTISNMSLYGAHPYIRFQLYTPVEFRCSVDKKILKVLQTSTDLKTEEGEAVKLLFASRKCNADGTTDVTLSIDTERFIFGQEISNLKILTGRIYRNTLVLPAECLYQKFPGEDSPWYAREVQENGVLIAEREVKIGYSNGEIVCVSGIEEGTYYDAGYKAVMGG